MNEARKRTALIIPFPVERTRESEPTGGEEGKLGRILLFTGVRYERLEEIDIERTDDHRPPRRGGGRS